MLQMGQVLNHQQQLKIFYHFLYQASNDLYISIKIPATKFGTQI